MPVPGRETAYGYVLAGGGESMKRSAADSKFGLARWQPRNYARQDEQEKARNARRRD